jgi:pyruvate dehydrogenase E1 component alpha subunit
MSLQVFSILSPEGTLVGEPPHGIDAVRSRYAAMAAARVYDRKASALQIQGRLATYASFEGQEATQIGSVAPLEQRDWLIATYRDPAAMNYLGYPWKNLLLARMGDERGGSPPEGVNVLPWSVTVGAHMIHAVGVSWAEKLRGTGAVAVTIFGDGATSEGDFHEAMNFAGVYQLPTVFVCQNNGWAISMPRSGQTASKTIAQKADGYGFPGVVVDGNDVLAVESVVANAVERARGGGGPTLVEAVTYRIQGHTTADDHDRYRSADHLDEWRDADPLGRLERYLAANGAWTEEWRTEIEQRVAAEIEAAVAEAEAIEPMTAEQIFDATFAVPTATLEAQRRESTDRT